MVRLSGHFIKFPGFGETKNSNTISSIIFNPLFVLILVERIIIQFQYFSLYVSRNFMLIFENQIFNRMVGLEQNMRLPFQVVGIK